MEWPPAFIWMLFLFPSLSIPCKGALMTTAVLFSQTLWLSGLDCEPLPPWSVERHASLIYFAPLLERMWWPGFDWFARLYLVFLIWCLGNCRVEVAYVRCSRTFFVKTKNYWLLALFQVSLWLHGNCFASNDSLQVLMSLLSDFCFRILAWVCPFCEAVIAVEKGSIWLHLALEYCYMQKFLFNICCEWVCCMVDVRQGRYGVMSTVRTLSSRLIFSVS